MLRAGIRDQVVTTVELKFNCFFLMPLLDAFPGRLREELEAAYAQVCELPSVGHLSGMQEAHKFLGKIVATSARRVMSCSIDIARRR